ncbi:hypothetical protein Taro_037487 [Colocasia esculenta]|uniref:Uncharacterized protein n=1 Tax=Colocasia esculenta TaxID=4460 RepID=A0A843WKZ3_COLES|nr:hypothetical protein [Colocasia esculenta]
MDPCKDRDEVTADEKGKKNGLVWAISYSPAAKNSSTRPQQDGATAPESDRERTLHWIAGQNLPYLT